MPTLSEEDRNAWKADLEKLNEDRKKLLRSTLAEGMYFRRERQWKVFYWSSSIFTVLIAGFLIRGTDKSFENPFFPIILTLAATMIVLLATDRIKADREQVGLRAALISEIDRDLTAWIGDLEKKYQPKRFLVGNRGMLWILYFVLMTLVWVARLYPQLGV